MKKLAFLLLLVVIMTGCCNSELLTSGKVISKGYQAERRWVQIVLFPITMKVGKSTITTFTSIPMFHHRPECWTIIIEGRVHDEVIQRNLYVPQEIYNEVGVGDDYTIQESDSDNIRVETRKATEKEKLTYGILPAEKK